ncbi:AI-2E family transporter [Alloiococcus sp. CFN-8]|uniref:AI-2E family transporter n=1 Tax=Alloiococcus sp. CFN-8 TaxID=3416081 RepID=UPI003CEEAEF7
MKPNQDNNFKGNLLLITYGLILAFVLLNIKTILNLFSGLLGVLSPFLIGIALAFVFNIPMKAIENKLIKPMFKGDKKRFARPIALVITLILIFGILTGIFVYVVPQLVSSGDTLVSNMDSYAESLNDFMSKYMGSAEVLNELWQKVVDLGENLVSLVGRFAGNILDQILGITISITTVIFNIFMGFLIAIYILLSKEKLNVQSKKLIYALMDKEKGDRVLEIARLSENKFSRFVSGQVIEAFILGFLCFIGMVIFRMPYALLISVVIGLTALIPVFGALIGTVPGAFIILMIEPSKVIWFIVLIVVVQQIEGNLIYPIVVGNSIGLSALWVLLAITLGAGYFGVLGMLIGVPLCGVLYTLFSIWINKRLREKGISSEELEDR